MRIFGLEKNVFYTGLVSFFMDLSSEMVYPLVPLFLTSILGVNKSVIGLIEGIAESTASLLKVVSGLLSDRMGNRKNLMIAGYGLAVMSRPILALAGTWHHILTARFVDRLGKGVRTAPRDAIIAEATPSANLGSSFGFHRAMDTAGAVIGPGIAFVLLGTLSLDYRSVFWLSILPGSIAVMIIIVCVAEKKRRSTAGFQKTQRIERVRLGRQALCFIAFATLFALGNSSDAFLILRAQQIGVPARVVPVLYLVFNLVYAAAALPAGIAADKFGRKRIILAGVLMFVAVYFGFGATQSSAAVWILFCLYGVFMGLTEGIQKAHLATIIPENATATGFGAYGTATGLAMLPASMIAGWLWDHVSPSAPFYFGAFTAGAAALIFILFCGSERAESHQHVE